MSHTKKRGNYLTSVLVVNCLFSSWVRWRSRIPAEQVPVHTSSVLMPLPSSWWMRRNPHGLVLSVINLLLLTSSYLMGELPALGVWRFTFLLAFVIGPKAAQNLCRGTRIDFDRLSQGAIIKLPLLIFCTGYLLRSSSKLWTAMRSSLWRTVHGNPWNLTKKHLL